MKKKPEKQLQKKLDKKVYIAVGIVAMILVIGGLVAYFTTKSYVNKVADDVICNNVYIGELDVSGMNAEEAKTAIEEQLSEYQALSLKLTAEEVAFDVTFGELGFDMKDVDKLVEEAVSYGKEGSIWKRYRVMKALEDQAEVLRISYKVDEESIRKVVTEKVPELENSAKDATITRKGGAFVIQSEVKGVAVSVEDSVKVISEYFDEEWKEKDGSIALVVTVDEPKITRTQLEQIQNLLGSYTTNCGTGGGRVQNIKTGAKLINGSVIMPGEVFSADAAMRPYTYDNGYAEAGAYENGKVVQSMGGGICQVSTTLYNAVILSELEVTQRAAHSMTVGYVKPSMDAAIAGEWKDLKFKNNTEYPIYIEGYVSGSYITFSIYGKETRPAGRKVEFVSETLSTTPATKKFVASGDGVGTLKKTEAGHTGVKARLWKVVKENGVEVSREIFNNSNYMASEETWVVGTSSSNAEAANVVKNAIASQDESKIKEAIAQAQAIIKAAEDAAKPAPEVPENPTEGN